MLPASVSFSVCVRETTNIFLLRRYLEESRVDRSGLFVDTNVSCVPCRYMFHVCIDVSLVDTILHST